MANRDAKLIERIIKDFSLNIDFGGSSIAIETEDIASLTDEQCEKLQCGQSVLVNRNNTSRIYSTTHKTNSELNLVSIYSNMGTSYEIEIVSYYHNAQGWYFGDRLITSLLASGIIPEIFDVETPTTMSNPMTAPIGTHFYLWIGYAQSQKIITTNVGIDEANKACPFILHYSSPEGSAHDEVFLMYPTITKSASLEIIRPRWESYGLPDRKIVATWDPVGDGTLGCDILELEKPITYTAGEGVQISEEHEISIDSTKVIERVELATPYLWNYSNYSNPTPDVFSITKKDFEKVLNGAQVAVKVGQDETKTVFYTPTKIEKIMANNEVSSIKITCNNSGFEPFQEVPFSSDNLFAYGKIELEYSYTQNIGTWSPILEVCQKLIYLPNVPTSFFSTPYPIPQLYYLDPTKIQNEKELLLYMQSISFWCDEKELYTFSSKQESIQYSYLYKTLIKSFYQEQECLVLKYRYVRYDTSSHQWTISFSSETPLPSVKGSTSELGTGLRLGKLDVICNSRQETYFPDRISFNTSSEFDDYVNGVSVIRWPDSQKGSGIPTIYKINNYNSIPATTFSAECIAKEMLDFDKASSINFEKLEYFSHHSYPTFKSNFAKGAFLNAGLSVGDKVCLTIAPQLDTSTGDPHFENLASLVKMTCECTNIEDETETWTISIFIYGTLTCTTTIEKNVNDTVTFPSLMNTLTYKEASEWTKVAEVNLPSIMDIYLDSEKYSNMLVIYHSAIEDYEFVRIADIDYVMKEIISDNSSSSSSSSGA